MTGWRSAAGSLVAAFAVLLWPGAAAASVASSGDVGHHMLFRFGDPAVLESSGLVDAGSVVYTMNDSGAGPVLYAVDADSGDTVGVTTYSRSQVEDVEALAPARGGTVWVGDIGDNLAQRRSVSVYRVRPGRGDAPRFELTYPGGPRDAEALLADPTTGRLYVVSKTVFGGVVYQAPRALDPGVPNRLRRFAQVPGLVTDAAFFPDGRHVLLRGYGTATVYTFPGLEPRGTFVLPAQRQGEGVAVGADGRVLLSSEGQHAPVLEVSLPPALAAEVTGAPSDAAASTGPSPSAGPSRAVGGAGTASDRTSGPDPKWVLGGAGLLAVLAALTWATRRR